MASKLPGRTMQPNKMSGAMISEQWETGPCNNAGRDRREPYDPEPRDLRLVSQNGESHDVIRDQSIRL